MKFKTLNSILFTLLFGLFASEAIGQSPQCSVSFTPQLNLLVSEGQSARVQSIIYGVDGEFFELNIPSQSIVAGKPFFLDLPGMDLEPGLHVLTYYVNTEGGKPIQTQATIGIRTNEDQPVATVTQLSENQSESFGSCACEQVLNGENPDASNWLNYFPNAEGDYVLLSSDDQGKTWTKPGVLDHTGDGCPQFALANLEDGSTLSTTKTQATPRAFVEMTAFPSPFVDQLNLRIKVEPTRRMVIRLVNGLGQVMEEIVRKDVNGTIEMRFNTSDLPQGPYFITVESDQGTYSRTVIRS